MAYYFSEAVILNQFLDFLDEYHIRPKYREDWEMDGLLHRFAVEGDRSGSKSGAYFIHPDDYPNWGAMDYHYHSEMQLGKLDLEAVPFAEREFYRAQLPRRETSQTFEEAEHVREFFAAKAREKAQKWEAENRQKLAQRQAEAAEAEKPHIIRAWQEYSYNEHTHPNSTRVYSGNDHEYLKTKHIDSCPYYFGLKVKAIYQPQLGHICRIGELLIPIIDAVTREFRSLQRIYLFNGECRKGFYPHIGIKGCCTELFPYNIRQFRDFTPEQFRGHYEKLNPRSSIYEADTLYICEGVATGLSILEILHIAGHKAGVVCALSCGNIPRIAQIWRAREPKLKIIIAADNDKSKAGQKAAIAAISAGYADDYNMPPIEGCDWNDYLNRMNHMKHINHMKEILS